MSKTVIAKPGDVRDVNATCNVLHVPRSAVFNSGDVLTTIIAFQGMLTSGQTIPPLTNNVVGGQSGVTWVGEQASDVMSGGWAKDIDGVVGTITLQLKPRVQYLDTILPGDLLFVFMDDTGDYDPSNRFSGTLVTVAIVDRCSKSKFIQQTTSVETIAVSARDLAVVLSESSTVFDQAFAQIENALYTGDFIGQLFSDKKQTALSPLENILILLLLLYDAKMTGSKLADLQWKLTTGDSTTSIAQLISLIDVTTFVQNPLPFYAIAEPPGIIQAGNVWSLLESYSNPVVNEFFIDVRDNDSQERQFRTLASANAKKNFYADNTTDVLSQKTTIQTVNGSNLFRTSAAGPADGTSVVAMVLRQRPYDADSFFALPFNTVDITEVETIDIARSSHDVFNWFRVRFPNLDVKLQEIVFGIRIVPQSIAKFGFRRMEAETRYMFASSETSTVFSKGSTKTDFGDVFRQYVDLLSTWYGQNEFWLAGQMTMRFKPKIRVGTRLLLTDGASAFNFYVQGVQHSFRKEPGASRTMLTLTRGLDIANATIPAVPTADFQHDGFAVNAGTQ